MNRFSYREPVALGLFAIGLSAIIAACSSSSDKGGGDTSDAGAGGEQTGALTILFSPMYSAYDGTHEFKIPAIVDGVKGDIKWTPSDPSMVDISSDPTTGEAMITTRKAGTVTIKAQLGNLSGTSNLTITQASPDDWTAGNERYNNGVVIFRPRDAGGQDAGSLQQAACTNCHGDKAAALDVQHTPQQTGGYSDDQLITIFTKGQKPAGVPMRTGIPADVWAQIHQWDMTPEEQKGVVVYLRSLEPKSQGPIDFGGRRGDGGTRPPRPDAGNPPPSGDDAGDTDAGAPGDAATQGD